MTEKRNGAAGAGTPGSANDVRPMGNGRKAIIPQARPCCQMEKLLALLPEGRENAIPMRDLADKLDINQRALRAAILQAREAGEIIAGDSAGYYRPADKAELRKYYFAARKRSLSGLKSLKAVRRKLAEIEGQQTFGDERGC